MSKRNIGFLCIIGTTLCYGLMPAVSFLAFDTGVKTETLLFNKFLLASVLMWVYVIIKKIPFKLSFNTMKHILAVTFAYAATAMTIYMAFEHISGSLATLIQFIYPTIVVLVEIVRGRESFSFKKIIAVILSFIGLIIVVWSPEIDINVVGILFALASAVLYAAYIIGISSESLKELETPVIAAYVLTGSMVLNWIRCIVGDIDVCIYGFEQFAYISFLAVVCAFVAILLFCIGVKYIGASNASIISTLEPVWVCVFGYLINGDAITKSMIAGGTAIILAVLITNEKGNNEYESTGRKNICDRP